MTLQGNFIDYVFVFSGGVLLSFTPCVYPLLPVTIGYIGARGVGSRKGFFLSIVYVFGVAITYSTLGLIAALTGKLFGRISTHPITYLVVGITFVFFGLSISEMLRIPLPSISFKKYSNKSGFLGIFILGLISGLAVGPCVAPALGAILVYIASKGNVFYGVSLLFTFAYGMGFLLILAGSFSGLLLNLPKSGNWLIKIKKICGLALVIVGIYFILKAGRIIL
jgi:thiol:disulfide interchange protein DsbD